MIVVIMTIQCSFRNTFSFQPTVIGFRRNEVPAPAPRRPIVIGHPANEQPRPAAPRPEPQRAAPRAIAPKRKPTVVIGVSYDNQA